jgi:hypothetical protein
MDVNKIKNRLTQFQNKGGGKKEQIDYTSIYWKPKPGKHVVRVVPSKFDKDYPFREVFFHYGLTKAPILALSNFGEKDPVMEFATALRKAGDEESLKMAKKLYPKMRVFAPVVVRGEEEKGVRLWEFGKQIYQELLGMAEDEDIGDFTDILGGRDMLITKVSPEEDGSLYGSMSVRPRTKLTPLSDDEDLVSQWLENQPDIMSLYKRYDFESLKEVLQNWLEPDSDEESTESKEETPAPPSNYSLKNAAKKSKTDEFDSLFNDDDAPF